MVRCETDSTGSDNGKIAGLWKHGDKPWSLQKQEFFDQFYNY